MDIIIIFLIEDIIYYLFIFSISINLLNAEYSKTRFIISCFSIFPLLILDLTCDYETIAFIQTLFQIIEIFMLRLCLIKVKLNSLVYLYIMFFCLNLTITSCIDSFLELGTPYQTYLECIVHTITFMICIILCHCPLKNNIHNIIMCLSRNIKILFLSIIICSSILSVLLAKDYLYRGIFIWNFIARLIFVVLTALISLVFPILIVYSVTNKHMKSLNENYKKQISTHSEYYIQLSQSITQLRRFKHDYNNMQIGLRKLLEEGKNKEALEMLYEQSQVINAATIGFDTGNGVVDALLNDKLRQADKINTIISFDGAVPKKSIKAVDLCIIFGNPLDNAIEACSRINNSTHKEIHIDCECNSGFAFIVITNPVQNKVEIRGNLPETTKPDKEMHGFGLYSLEKVIKKYDGEVNCECDENTFTLSMEFSIPVKNS